VPELQNLLFHGRSAMSVLQDSEGKRAKRS